MPVTENFNKEGKILDSLADKSATTRKTILSALVVLTDNDTYRQEMLKDIKQYQQQMDNLQMSEKQLKNGVSQEDIIKKLKDLKKPAMLSLKKKKDLTKADYMHIQNYVLQQCAILYNKRNDFLSLLSFEHNFIKLANYLNIF